MGINDFEEFQKYEEFKEKKRQREADLDQKGRPQEPNKGFDEGQQPRNLPLNEAPPEEPRISRPDDKITKRMAAREVYIQAQRSKLCAIIGIAGVFIVALCTTFNVAVGSASAAILALILGVFLFLTVQRQRDLQRAYGFMGKEPKQQKWGVR